MLFYFLMKMGMEEMTWKFVRDEGGKKMNLDE